MSGDGELEFASRVAREVVLLLEAHEGCRRRRDRIEEWDRIVRLHGR